MIYQLEMVVSLLNSEELVSAVLTGTILATVVFFQQLGGYNEKSDSQI